MAELAVRLDSIDEYDRRGDVVALDDFESPLLKWIGFNSPACTSVLDSTVAKSGSQSVKFTTFAALARYAGLTRSFAVLGTARIGMEFSVCDVSAGMDIIFRLRYWDGVAGWEARIWYDNSTNSFYVEDTVALNWVLIATLGAMRLGEQLFYPIKIVVDFTTHTYERFLYENTEYDLSTRIIPALGGVGGEHLVASIQFPNDAGAVGTAWADDFILTQNEP